MNLRVAPPTPRSSPDQTVLFNRNNNNNNNNNGARIANDGCRATRRVKLRATGGGGRAGGWGGRAISISVGFRAAGKIFRAEDAERDGTIGDRAQFRSLNAALFQLSLPFRGIKSAGIAF